MGKASAYKRLLQKRIEVGNIIKIHQDKINGRYITCITAPFDRIQRAGVFTLHGSEYRVYRLDNYEYLVILNLQPIELPKDKWDLPCQPEYTYKFEIILNPDPKLIEKAKRAFAVSDAEEVHNL